MRYRNDPSLTDRQLTRARTMRRDLATDVERRLWRALRRDQLGAHFRRQQPVGPYVPDFVCFSARLVIELDGGQHAEGSQLRRDDDRDAWFGANGYRVLRFWNNRVLENLDGVLRVITDALQEPP